MTRTTRSTAIGALLALVLVVSGCSADGGGKDTASSSTTTTTTVAGSTTTAADTTTSTASGSTGSNGSNGSTGSNGSNGSDGGTTAPPPTAPPTTKAPGPAFASFSVTADTCPTPPAPDVSVTIEPSMPDVHVSWSVTGTFDSIYDAVDNADGAYRSNLGASGSDAFARDCNATHTYYVVIVANGQKIKRSMTINPG